MIKNKVLFITGASRGIGKATVEKFQAENWTVAACASTSQSAQASPADLSLSCDVREVKQVKQCIKEIIKQFGRLDAVINNAGLAGENPLNANADDELWHEIINTNLNGTYYVCKYALPHLPDQTGRIINISSVLGLKGVPDQTAYSAAKHGVMGFTKALAHYAAPRGITVNAICPGWVRTDMMHGRMQEMQLSEADLLGSVPLGKIIEPAQIADLAFYLVNSKAAESITGQGIVIDGGVLA